MLGLPPVTGLYTAIVPAVAYGIFTTSLHVQAGPSALCAIMTNALIASEAPDATPEEKMRWATALSFVVAVQLFVFGMFRMGALVNFISRPLLEAFMSAASILIMTSQAKALFGLTVPEQNYPIMELVYIVEHLNETKPYTFLIGGGTFVFLIMFRCWKKSSLGKRPKAGEDPPSICWKITRRY